MSTDAPHFILKGDSRGCCRHYHPTVEDAAQCLLRYERYCSSHGLRSDRVLMRVPDWRTMDDWRADMEKLYVACE